VSDKKELLIRVRERINIYRDSPNVNVTYVDLAQVLEIMQEMLDAPVVDGFKKEAQ